MRSKPEHEQHIAVFGEGGSGKTVLVSSFYGATQEPAFLKASLFDVTADDAAQGHRLHANYLGMRNSARPPLTTRFGSTSYAFSVKLKDRSEKGNRSRPFDAVRLVWHDYPGDWFREDPGEPEEAQRRIATFRSLLGSDVAILLVDGQRLLDNTGEEARYLKSLLGSFRSGLLRLEDQLLEGGKPLVRFPRIWILALSKADLLPELDVFGFRDLIIGTASDDLAELRRVLERFVESPGALAVGEDFLRLSSAKFEPNRIEVTERIGLDLILPLASMLPFERHMRWIKKQQIGTKVAADLLANAEALAFFLSGNARWAGVVGRLIGLIGDGAKGSATDLGRKQLMKLHEDAVAKRDYMAAVLSRFALDLDDAEDERILLRSRK
jgi:hypothetical protein